MSDGSPERGQKRNDSNLESKKIDVQFKRYYVDVNENPRGRFIKIAELGNNYKGRIMLTLPAAVALRDQMNIMLDLIEKDTTTPTGKEAVLVKSETLTIDGRRFYIDLKANERGRFLRVAQMPGNSRQERQQIAIPSSGIAEIRDALSDFITKYGDGFTGEQESKGKFITENKTFTFNVGENDRGKYVRISEVKLNSGYRSAITVPMPAFEEFRKALDSAVATESKA